MRSIRKSDECPRCKSKNFAAVVTEEDIEPFSIDKVMGKKQGKYRHIFVKGTPYNDEGGCECGPFEDEWEVKALLQKRRRKEKRIGNPRYLSRYVLTCNKQYHLDWTVTERNYF